MQTELFSNLQLGAFDSVLSVGVVLRNVLLGGLLLLLAVKAPRYWCAAFVFSQGAELLLASVNCLQALPYAYGAGLWNKTVVLQNMVLPLLLGLVTLLFSILGSRRVPWLWAMLGLLCAENIFSCFEVVLWIGKSGDMLGSLQVFLGSDRFDLYTVRHATDLFFSQAVFFSVLLYLLLWARQQQSIEEIL